jgi:hypothetical protein
MREAYETPTIISDSMDMNHLLNTSCGVSGNLTTGKGVGTSPVTCPGCACLCSGNASSTRTCNSNYKC